MSEELSEDIKKELGRRLADMEANPEDDLPWEDVKAEILSELAADKALRVNS